MANFEKAFNGVIILEGRYSDDPSDSGGKTMFGITEAKAREHGYRGDMRKITISMVRKIYLKDFWNALKLTDVPDQAIAEELFESSVNCGPGRTSKWLQRSLNALRAGRWSRIAVDGKVGRKTIGALCIALNVDDRNAGRILKALNILQGAHYLSLATTKESQQKFIGGWLDRRVRL